MRRRGSYDRSDVDCDRSHTDHNVILLQSTSLRSIMVKGKLERRYKLVHNGRELSKGLLSEAGKYDAFQILVQRFDMGIEGAIDPDEVEVIDMKKEEN